MNAFDTPADLVHEAIAIIRVVADADAADGRDEYHAVLSIADVKLQQAEQALEAPPT